MLPLSILITFTVTSIRLLTTADACLLHIGPMDWETDGAALSVIDHSVCVSRLLCAACLCVNMWQKTRSKLFISWREFTRKTIFKCMNVNEADTERTENNWQGEQRRMKDETCCSYIKVKVLQCEPAWTKKLSLYAICWPRGILAESHSHQQNRIRVGTEQRAVGVWEEDEKMETDSVSADHTGKLTSTHPLGPAVRPESGMTTRSTDAGLLFRERVTSAMVTNASEMQSDLSGICDIVLNIHKPFWRGKTPANTKTQTSGRCSAARLTLI